MAASMLNLGCGNVPLKGAINHDIVKHAPWVDVVHDLNVFPWPWEDEQFEVVKAWAVLEHLRADRLQIMNELWRILKPGGVAAIKLPAWDSEEAHDDITHYWFVALHSMDQFDPDTERGRAYSFYTTRKWKILKAKHSNKGHSSIYFQMRKRG